MSRCCGYWDQRSSDIKLQLSSSFTTFLNEAFCNKGSSNCRTRLLCFMLKQKTLSFISVQWCSIWKKPNEMTPCIPVWKVGLRTVKVAKVWVKYFYHDIFPYFPFASLPTENQSCLMSLITERSKNERCWERCLSKI